MFALGAPLFAQRPLQYTVHCRAQQTGQRCGSGQGAAWVAGGADSQMPWPCRLCRYYCIMQSVIPAGKVWDAAACHSTLLFQEVESTPVYAHAGPAELSTAAACLPQYWCSQPLTRAISTRGVRSRHIAQVMSSASSADSAVSACNASQQAGARELRAGAPLSDTTPQQTVQTVADTLCRGHQLVLDRHNSDVLDN